MPVSALWPFLMVLWFYLQCVIVAFSGHTHFLSVVDFQLSYSIIYYKKKMPEGIIAGFFVKGDK